MRDPVILGFARTPIGRFGGVFRDVPATRLAALSIRASLERAGVDPADVDEVVLGQCYPNGEAPAIGRVAALDSGLGISVTGMQVDRRCASGLEAIWYATTLVATGAADVVIAGGVESMSRAEFYTESGRFSERDDDVLLDRLDRARKTAGGINHPVPGGMLETAENLRVEYRITREEQDALALQSHQRAVAAQRAGYFDAEIVPVTVGGTKVTTDEHPRADTSGERLARLRPVLGATDPDATVTAGNSAGQNDAAATCVVTTSTRAATLGAAFAVSMRSCARAGVAPERMGIGPVPATKRALADAGLTLDEVGLIELNEAFAAQVLAVLREWDLDPTSDRLNPNGSGISLGHPVGATGCRLLVTMAGEMERRGSQYGLETLCAGGGQGIAAVFERV